MRGSSARPTARSPCTPTSPPPSPRWRSRWTTGAGRRSWSRASTFPRWPISGSHAPATEWRSSSSRARTASTVPVEAIARAVDDRTAFVATSHVFFTSGAIQDVRAVGRRRPPARGAAAGGRLSGGRPAAGGRAGAGCRLLLRRRPQVAARRDRRRVPVRAARAVGARSSRARAGWFAHREQFRFDPRSLELHDDARRFEAGTPSLMSVYAQLGGLELLEELGRRSRSATAPWRWPKT